MANQMVKRLMAICRAEGLQARTAPAMLDFLKLAQGIVSIVLSCDTARAWCSLCPAAAARGVCMRRSQRLVSIRGVVLRFVPGAALVGNALLMPLLR